MTEEQKKTILVVEDEASMSMALVDLFTGKGYAVLSAQNGSEGLAVALEKHPDLIFTDIRMPVMDGIQMITELRKDVWGKVVPVVLLSNVSDIATVQEAMNQGSFFYLVKGDSSMRDIAEMARIRLGLPATSE